MDLNFSKRTINAFCRSREPILYTFYMKAHFTTQNLIKEIFIIMNVSNENAQQIRVHKYIIFDFSQSLIFGITEILMNGLSQLI
jgi:hypothetical protein